jgi:hypothetical protein
MSQHEETPPKRELQNLPCQLDSQYSAPFFFRLNEEWQLAGGQNEPAQPWLHALLSTTPLQKSNAAACGAYGPERSLIGPEEYKKESAAEKNQVPKSLSSDSNGSLPERLPDPAPRRSRAPARHPSLTRPACLPAAVGAARRAERRALQGAKRNRVMRRVKRSATLLGIDGYSDIVEQ